MDFGLLLVLTCAGIAFCVYEYYKNKNTEQKNYPFVQDELTVFDSNKGMGRHVSLIIGYFSAEIFKNKIDIFVKVEKMLANPESIIFSFNWEEKNKYELFGIETFKYSNDSNIEFQSGLDVIEETATGLDVLNNVRAERESNIFNNSYINFDNEIINNSGIIKDSNYFYELENYKSIRYKLYFVPLDKSPSDEDFEFKDLCVVSVVLDKEMIKSFRKIIDYKVS